MLLDPDLLRSKADAFDSGLRGYLKHDVAAYLGRIALAVEVLGEDTGPPPALPADFQPDAIRTHEFDVVWRGLDREEVRAFLTQLADELESRLSSTDTSSTGTPAAGLSMSDRMREASGDLAPPTADTVRIEAPTAGPVVPKIDVPTIDAGLPTGEVPSISTHRRRPKHRRPKHRRPRFRCTKHRRPRFRCTGYRGTYHRNTKQ